MVEEGAAWWKLLLVVVVAVRCTAKIRFTLWCALAVKFLLAE